MSTEDEIDIGKGTEQTDIQEEDYIDPTILKQRQTTAIGKVTRKRNELVICMLNVDNLHEVKTQLAQYDQLFVAYQEAHTKLYDVLTTEDAQNGESKRYQDHENEIQIFRQNVLCWIIGAERKLTKELDDLSGLRSHSSKRSKTSQISKAGSTQSALAHEKAELAALLVQREQMSKQRELDDKMQALKAEQEKLQLDLKIKATLAKSQVYSNELDTRTHHQLKREMNAIHVEPIILDDITNANRNVTNTDVSISQGNHDHAMQIPTHFHANVIVNDPVSEHNVGSVKTINHEFITSGSQLREMRHTHQNQDTSQKPQASTTPLVTSSQAPSLQPVAAMNVLAPSFQPSQNAESYPYQPSLRDLVTAMTLPLPEVQKFSGDPIEYHTFIMAFDTRIASKTSSNADRLYYLNQYLEGEAKDFIAGCLHMDPVLGYTEARRILDKQFGDSYKISSAYIDKVMSWTIIKHDDSLALRKFAIYLNKCVNAMKTISDLTVLNHLLNLQVIVFKLPGYLQNKWRGQATRIKTQEGRIPQFQDLAYFIEIASDSANDPVFGKVALNKYAGSHYNKYSTNSKAVTKKSFAITLDDQPNVSNTRTTNPTITNKQKCLLCHNSSHDLNDCYTFLKKTIDERRSFLMSKKACFACFETNRTSKGCLNKRICKKCNKTHPTSLHIDNFQLSRHNETQKFSQPTTNSSVSRSDEYAKTYSCRIANEANTTVLQSIIPVRVQQQGHNTSVLTYAFFDNGSDGCFLSDDLMHKLDVNGQATTLLLRTMNGETRVKTTAVNDLIVSSYGGDTPITLPRCFSRESIPVDHTQIPKPNVLSKWQHLHEATSNMPPYLPDVPVGLLIGSNCPKALQPIKVIPSSGDGPFAVKYHHGWTINGPLRLHSAADGTPKVTYCNRIIVQEVKVKEIMTTNDMFRLFDTDFGHLNNDEVPGQLGHSQEDDVFMKKAETGIQHTDGHYVLPLPFRESNFAMSSNRNQALKRAHWQRKKMIANEKYRNDYTIFVNNLLQCGYAKKILQDDIVTESGNVWYLPHHGVYHPTKSKIRVVFDCSAKFNGSSLNDHLLQGPDLTNTLFGVLTRFRQEPVAFIGDIEAMFHQVRVIKEHQNFLRFLWWPQGELQQDLEEYAMTVHLFGATSSPSIANFALKRTADEAEHHINATVAATIRRNFYVDDCLKAVPTVVEAIQMISDLKSACSLGGFKIAKFCSNSAEVLSSVELEDRSKDLQEHSLDYQDLPAESPRRFLECQ